MDNPTNLEQCLICRGLTGETRPPGEARSSLLSSHLDVIFLLRKVLQVPVATLSSFLEGCHDVGAWVCVCESCQCLVKKCRTIFQQLCEVERKWNESRIKVTTVIKETQEQEDKRKGLDFELVDITKEVRRFVRNHEYSTLKPFVEGTTEAPVEVKVEVEMDVDQMAVTSLTEDDRIDDDDESSESPPPSPVSPSLSPKKRTPKPKSGTRSNSKPTIECHLCGKAFSLYNKVNLLSHLYRIHKVGDLPFPCDNCGKKFPERKKLLRHQTSKSCQANKSGDFETVSPGVSCHICGKVPSDRITLPVHLFRAHGVGILPFCCERCGKMFGTEGQLASHLPQYCKGPRARETKETYQLKCPVAECPHVDHGADMGKHRQHLLEAHSKEEREALPPRPKIFGCLKCPFVFTSAQQHKQHQMTHVPREDPQQKSWVCEVCGAAFAFKDRLLQHQKVTLRCRRLKEGGSSTTDPNRRFICDLCGTECNTRGTLTKHIQFIHKKEFRVHCDICGYATRTKTLLRKHTVGKHGVGGFSCQEEGCEKMYFSEKLLQCHVNQKHLKGPREFKCDDCEKEYYFKNALLQHRRLLHPKEKQLAS